MFKSHFSLFYSSKPSHLPQELLQSCPFFLSPWRPKPQPHLWPLSASSWFPCWHGLVMLLHCVTMCFLSPPLPCLCFVHVLCLILWTLSEGKVPKAPPWLSLTNLPSSSQFLGRLLHSLLFHPSLAPSLECVVLALSMHACEQASAGVPWPRSHRVLVFASSYTIKGQTVEVEPFQFHKAQFKCSFPYVHLPSVIEVYAVCLINGSNHWCFYFSWLGSGEVAQ